MNREQAIIELRQALEAITNIPFVTSEAYHIANKALVATRQYREWVTNDGV